MKIILCLLLLLFTETAKADNHTWQSNASTRKDACDALKWSVIREGAKWLDNCDCRLDEGWYFCQIPKPVKDSTNAVTYITTAGARSREEACERVKSLANKEGYVLGECSCEKRGKVNICHVLSIGPKQDGPLIDEMMHDGKRVMRRTLDCKPDDKECVNAAKKNASSGVRD